MKGVEYMLKYRLLLKLYNALYRFLTRHRKIACFPFIILCSYFFFKGKRMPSYQREYFMWTISAFMLIIVLVILKSKFQFVLKSYFKLQQTALDKYPNLYEKRHREKRKTFSSNENRKKTSDTTNSQKPAKKEYHPSQDFFAGTDDPQSIKQRYKELLKIYHPDNSNGDASIAAIINAQYKEKLKFISK